MSDDLNKKIKQITDVLGQENLPDNLKGLLSLLASSAGKPEDSEKTAEAPEYKAERSEKGELDENLEMIRRVKKMMDKVNVNNDPRVNLLNAVKPFMSNSRQKKINNCVKLLIMSNLTKYMDEFDK